MIMHLNILACFLKTKETERAHSITMPSNVSTMVNGKMISRMEAASLYQLRTTTSSSSKVGSSRTNSMARSQFTSVKILFTQNAFSKGNSSKVSVNLARCWSANGSLSKAFWILRKICSSNSRLRPIERRRFSKKLIINQLILPQKTSKNKIRDPKLARACYPTWTDPSTKVYSGPFMASTRFKKPMIALKLSSSPNSRLITTIKCRKKSKALNST